MVKIDPIARKEALEKFALPECLHIPVAARDIEAISKYVGEIKQELSREGTGKAFLLEVPPANERRMDLPIWNVPGSEVLHKAMQIWVHVDYRGYRRAYSKGLPNEDISNMVLDHVMNRRIARLKGFEFTRLVPVDRAVNSSSAFSENWGVDYHATQKMQEIHGNSKKSIQYADLSDIVSMLNIKPGGGNMDVVRDADILIDPSASNLDVFNYLAEVR